jgi:SH3-like domain-containing protein
VEKIGSMAAKIQGIGARMWAPSKPDEAVSPLVGTRMFIRPSSANLRSSPATDADSVGVVERATVVEIVTDKGSWLEVRTVGRSIKRGWIHRSLLADKPFG